MARLLAEEPGWPPADEAIPQPPWEPAGRMDLPAVWGAIYEAWRLHRMDQLQRQIAGGRRALLGLSLVRDRSADPQVEQLQERIQVDKRELLALRLSVEGASIPRLRQEPLAETG